MVEYKQGDLLKATEVNIIGHQTNCLGVMGAGIAKSIRKKYPLCFEAYKSICDKEHGNLLGSVQYVVCSPTVTIANMFGQNNIGDGLQTDYEALEKCIINIHDKAKAENKTVGLPYKIGCGLAGGDWNIVKEMIEKHFSDEVVCHVYSIDSMDINPENDGIDHINIYSQGKTGLGRMLSNFYKYPIVSKYYGQFNSIEGLWYYMSIEPCPEREELRKLYGFQAKQFGKELLQTHASSFEENFEDKILEAIWYKFRMNYKLLTPEFYSLPFLHYYNYKGKIIDVSNKYDWMVEGIDKMRVKLIDLINKRKASLWGLMQQIDQNDRNVWVHLYSNTDRYMGTFHYNDIVSPRTAELKDIADSPVIQRTYVFDGLSSLRNPSENDICVKIDNDFPSLNFQIFPEMMNWNTAVDYVGKIAHLHM